MGIPKRVDVHPPSFLPLLVLVSTKYTYILVLAYGITESLRRMISTESHLASDHDHDRRIHQPGLLLASTSTQGDLSTK